MSDDNDTGSPKGSTVVPFTGPKSTRPLAERLEKANGLNRKDKLLLFARAIAEGIPPPEAYSRSFGELRPSQAERKAAALLNQDRIKAMISQAQTRRVSVGAELGESYRIHVAERLFYESTHCRSDGARILAIKALGELGFVQAFKKPDGDEKPELPQDLLDKIEKLLGGIKKG